MEKRKVKKSASCHDLPALTKGTAELVDIRYVLDIDKGRVKKILGS